METFIPSLKMLSYFAIVFFSIVMHECAHAWVAFKFGDPTAKEAGRLTLNPLKHIDPFTTLFLPGLLLFLHLPPFGMAKPVPVNFARLRNPKKNMIWVGVSGPITNVTIAIILSLLVHVRIFSVNNDLILMGIFINLVLAVLNMIPIPPLDGSRLVMGLLPDKLAIPYMKIERFGIFILAALIFYFNLFDYVVLPIVALLGYVLGINLTGF